MDLLAWLVASLTMPALIGAAAGGVLGYWAWGYLGAVLGVIGGYAAGVWYATRFYGTPLSPHVKGWLSMLAFLGGLTLLAILTR
jgi:hypothetical protein